MANKMEIKKPYKNKKIENKCNRERENEWKETE